MILAILLFCIGKYVNAPMFILAGATIMFIVSFVFLTGYLEIPSGTVAQLIGNTTNSTTTTVYTYNSYSNFWIAFILNISSIAVWIFGLSDYIKMKKAEREE